MFAILDFKVRGPETDQEREGKFTVFDRGSAAPPRPSTPGREANIRDFYAVELEARGDANLAEDALSKLEGIFSHAITAVNRDSVLPADDKVACLRRNSSRPNAHGTLVPGGCNVEHDSLGNVIKEPTRAGHTKLEFFHSGGAKRIENDDGVIAMFQYDGFGALAGLSIERAATVVRRDRHVGAYITARTHKGPQESSTYVERRFPGPGVVVSRRGSGGPWIYRFSEGRGTRITTDGTSKFVQDVSYTPFGQATSTGASPGSSLFTTDHWNAGDALDSLGLVYVGARLYDPVIGRFLSRDPLLLARSAATSNPYAFALNDPINLADPTGLCAGSECDIGIQWFGGFWSSGGRSAPQTDRGKEILVKATLQQAYPGPAFNFDSPGASMEGAIDAAKMNGTYYGASVAGATWAAVDATSEVLPVIGTARKAWRREWGAAALSLTLDVLTLGEGRFIAAAAGESGGGGLLAAIVGNSAVSDLRGLLRFAHGTAPESVASVRAALSAVKSIEKKYGTWASGSFFATKLAAPGTQAASDALQVAYNFGLRHSPRPVVMIGQIPESIASELIARKVLVFEHLGDGVIGLVLHPPGFKLFNSNVEWLQVLNPSR